MPDPRRSFAPAVLAGLSGGVVAAVGGSRAWSGAAPGERGDTASALSAVVAGSGAGEMPLAGALALVALAAWGVLLLTRGRVRRVMAALAALASLGVLVAVVVGAATLPGRVGDELEAVGVSSVGVGLTAAFWATAAGGLLCLAAAVQAVRAAPSWPEMGRRYDAPAAGSEPPLPAEGEAGNLDLWKALDQGRDPTD